MRGVDEGKAQIGFANSSTTVDGIAGRAPYPKKVTKVCQVANLYPQYFQVVALADAKVNSFADLKGKSLVTQPKGNTAEILTGDVLKLNGMSYQSLAKVNFQAGYTDAVSLMKDGHAQVFTLGTTAPASAVMDLASARDIKLVPVDDKTMAELKKMNPGYNKLVIKAGTYPKQDKDVPVIGYSTHIVAACDLPEDMVYKMTKAMAANIDDMAAVVKAITGVTRQGHGASTSACRSTRARSSTTRKRARCRRAAPGMTAARGGAAAPFLPAACDRRRPTKTPATTPALRGAALARASRRRGGDVAVPHVRRRLRPARGDHLPRHAPAVRADAGLPALPARPGAGRRRLHRSRRCSRAAGDFVLHIFLNYRLLHQPHHLHRRPDALGQVLRGRRGASSCSRRRGA